MRTLLLVWMLLITYAGAANLSTTPTKEKEKKKKGNAEKVEEPTGSNKNFHSIKRWKMTIELKNGKVISKIISIEEGSTSRSALDTAFMEAEKYLKRRKNVKNYHISAVSQNSFVLLAGD